MSRGRRWVGVLAAFHVVVLVGIVLVVLTDPERRELGAATRGGLGGTYVTLSDGVVHYRLTGPPDGPPVVLVHGGTIPMWTWDATTDALVEAGFRVLAYDAFGRGYSDRPDLTYDRTLYRRQLAGITDSLDVTEPFHLVGISMGGGTVVDFTATHPERVARLALIAPVVRDYDVPGLFRVPVVGEAAARLVGVGTLVRRTRSLLEGLPAADRYMEAMREQTTYRGFRRSILSMLRNDALGDFTGAYREVGRQDRPVLLVWGTEDEEITGEMMETARRLVPDVEFRAVEGAGHGIVFRRADVVNRYLKEFLLAGDPLP